MSLNHRIVIDAILAFVEMKGCVSMVQHCGRLLLILLTIATGGCAISPGPETTPPAMCNFVRHHLDVDIPENAAPSGTPEAAADTALREGADDPGAGSFGDALRANFDRARLMVDSDPAMLFISGGSQHGAFGAGYLHGWSQARGGLPQFEVVTGVSTGAILSTWAFIGDTQTLVDNYRLSRETEVLRPIVPAATGPIRTGLTVARRGAVGDLAPLRAQLRRNLTDDVLQRVRLRADGGAKLYVGAVDVDTGRAVVFDLTEMAQRYFQPAYANRRDLVRNCYAEAIIASSSVPLAALPAFLDNRMYIDGGARFGMFSQEIGEVIDQQAQTLAPAARPAYFVLVNGDIETSGQCGKADPRLCEPPHPETGGLHGVHADWSLDALAFRSVEILINQGYRFSTSRLQTQADQAGVPLRLARIRPDLDRHVYRLRDHRVDAYAPHPVLGAGQMTCPEWLEYDRRVDRPLEFHPRYMHCLVDYGETRGRDDGWARHARR